MSGRVRSSLAPPGTWLNGQTAVVYLLTVATTVVFAEDAVAPR
jgi:hypothetical protein